MSRERTGDECARRVAPGGAGGGARRGGAERPARTSLVSPQPTRAKSKTENRKTREVATPTGKMLMRNP